MPLVRRLLLVGLLQLGIAGCGQPDPLAMPVSMPECIYSGPSSMHPGNARVTLGLNGITNAGVVLARLDGDHAATDLTDRLDGEDGRWGSQPGWVSPVAELRLDAAQGLDGVEQTVSLDPGSYVVVCLEYPVGDGDPTATIAGQVRVVER